MNTYVKHKDIPFVYGEIVEIKSDCRLYKENELIKTINRGWYFIVHKWTKNEIAETFKEKVIDNIDTFFDHFQKIDIKEFNDIWGKDLMNSLK